MTVLNKLHHRFLQFYDEFEGDAVACLALHNSYVMACVTEVEKKSRMKDKKVFVHRSRQFIGDRKGQEILQRL